MRLRFLVAIFPLLALALAGCAAGVTVSGTPQFGIQACVLSAEPLVFGQRDIDARAYGYADGSVLWGAPTWVPYGQRSAVS
ncbi:MAG: hypothetical protein FJ290_04190 [Planctomycetes bacterium]|nr:hypothetical protein [Planctomycetota bacterium]